MEGKTAAVFAGGRRIRQNKKKITVSSDENTYIKSINLCNEKINKMKDNDYIKFRDYSTQLLSQICNEIKRDNFSNRDEFRNFKKEKLKFIYSRLFYPVNEVKILFKSDNYRLLKGIFNDSGLKIVNNIINRIENCLIEKKYDVRDENKIYNSEQFISACKTLKIENAENKRLFFSTIRNAYNKEMEYGGGNTEYKENVSKAFILLRDQYENYLKSFTNEGSVEEETKIE